MLRWWPVVGISLMMLLGWAVGKASTPIDDWVLEGRDTWLRYLLFFTDARVSLTVMLVTAAVVGYQRRWLMAAAVLATPIVAVSTVAPLKQVFGRVKDEGIAYPSGHTTLMITTMGMVVLGLGVALWKLLAAAIWALLGIAGISVTFHYFTDAVGAVFLGTSFVAMAAALLDRCQPRGDLRHISRLRWRNDRHRT